MFFGMEVRVESWILGVVLYCTVFIVLVHPEEVFVSTKDYRWLIIEL